MSNNIPSTSDLPSEISLRWQEYANCIASREDSRTAAEAADKQRRKYWRSFYIYNKRITELNRILGIDEHAQDIIDEEKEESKVMEKACPGAPKKRALEKFIKD